MRYLLYSTAVVLLVLLLLYGGLNVVEQSMQELLALDREPAAFALRRLKNGSVELIFSGSTYSLDLDRLFSTVQNWWELMPWDGGSGG
ncbi:MAG: hypothetical protein AB1767_12720 [Bacillota bacterium]